MDSKYQSYFAGQSQYQRGATYNFLAEHTWALGVSYTNAATTVGLDMTGAGRVPTLRDDFFHRNLNVLIRLPQNRLNVNNSPRYVNFNDAYSMADLTASHRFTHSAEAVLQIQNLTDRYRNDYEAAYAVMGRQTKVGLRVRLP